MRARTARLAFSSGLIAVLLILGACGEGTSPTEPRAQGRLFHTSDLPQEIRAVEPPNTITDPAEVARILHGPIFKDEEKDVARRLRSLGFVRAEVERFFGAGTTVGATAFQFRSPAQARAAQSYMYEQLLKPCPGREETACAESRRLSVPDIPGAKGQVWTPIPEPPAKNLPKYRSSMYRVLFVVGSLVVGVEAGGEPGFFDPGSVPREDALAVFTVVYDRVREMRPAAIFPSPFPLPEDCPPGTPDCPNAEPTPA